MDLSTGLEDGNELDCQSDLVIETSETLACLLNKGETGTTAYRPKLANIVV